MQAFNRDGVVVATAVPVQVGDTGAHELFVADGAMRLGLCWPTSGDSPGSACRGGQPASSRCLSAWSQIVQSSRHHSLSVRHSGARRASGRGLWRSTEPGLRGFGADGQRTDACMAERVQAEIRCRAWR